MTRGALLSVVCLALAWSTRALEDALTADDFDVYVKDQHVTLLLIYSPTDAGSRGLAPNFRQAALDSAEDDDGVSYAKLDYSIEANRAIGAERPDMYGIRGVPTLLVIHGGGGGPGLVGSTLLKAQGLTGPKKDALGNLWEPYVGGAEAHELVWWMAQLAEGLNPIAEERLQRVGLYEGTEENEDGVIWELDGQRTKNVTRAADDDRYWVIEAYSDRCPVCISMAPGLIIAARNLKATFGRKVKVAALNVRVWYDEDETLTAPVIFPWLLLYHKGEKIADVPGEHTNVEEWVREEIDKRKTVVVKPSRLFDDDLLDEYEGEEEEEEEREVVAKSTTMWREPLASDYDDVVDSDPEFEVDASSATTAPAAAAASSPVVGEKWRAALGAHSWFYLHTLAATLEEEPGPVSDASRRAVLWTIGALGELYPCATCRSHLREKLATTALGPPDVTSRGGLSLWFCRLHNMVNDDLNKPRFDCSLEKLDALYRRGCGDCTNGPFAGIAETTSFTSLQVAGWDAEEYVADPEAYIAKRKRPLYRRKKTV